MKIVHLHLNEPHEGQTDFYFGSIKAIYDTMPKETVGITYKALTAAILKKGGKYENTKCTIDVGQLVRKNNSRTKEK